VKSLDALFGAVESAPHAHDFFALLRRIECLRPDAPRLGCALRPAQEPLRLGQEPELDFAPAALTRFELGAAVPRLGVRFFGLLGPQGPMPLHLTEYVRERTRRRGDPSAARFLDVFHHRLLCLFYRAWAQAQPTVQQDRPHADRYAAWLGATSGLAGAQGDGGEQVPPEAKLYQAGLLGSRSRHAEGLEKILRLYFGVGVRVRQHVPQWLPLENAERSRLGHARNRPERVQRRPGRLGSDATPGNKACDRQCKFRIVLGPLTLAQYHAFLPGGTAWQALAEWVRQWIGLALQWDLQLCLARDEVPEPRLDRRVQLGLSAWAGSVPQRRQEAHDRSDLRLRPGRSFVDCAPAR
jgi:type VI secretion system protein ImpH